MDLQMKKCQVHDSNGQLIEDLNFIVDPQLIPNFHLISNTLSVKIEKIRFSFQILTLKSM